MRDIRRRLLRLLLAVTLIMAIATAGYMIIEGWSLIDAFYMTMITLTTVGFGEIEPLSELGRVFTIVIIFFGVGIIALSFSTVGEYMLMASMAGQMRQRRMRRMIEQMENHVIICGFGRVGQSAATVLRDSQAEVVVVDKEEDASARARSLDFVVIEGDATRDEILQEAAIERAGGLIVCTGDDSQNLFIVLSGRTLNPNLHIVARSVAAENERKMRRAGANRVVSPHHIGGRHMANIMIRPHVTDFFDVVTLDNGIQLWVEELTIGANSGLAGKTVGEADVRRRTGVTLVALLRHASGTTTMPDAHTRLEPGDELIVLGTREQLAALAELTDGEVGHLNGGVT